MSAMTQPDEPGPQAPLPPPPPSSWRPPRSRDSNLASIVVGLIILGIGLWYFLDTTLGLTMPRIDWDNMWPIILIVIGGVIVFRSATNRGG